MSRFKACKILVRRLPDVVIVFYNKESIYCFPRGYSNGTIFHRWFAPKGTYGASWQPFRRKLLRYKHLDMAKCHELAQYHGVLYVGTDRAPQLKGKTIKYLDK